MLDSFLQKLVRGRPDLATILAAGLLALLIAKGLGSPTVITWLAVFISATIAAVLVLRLGPRPDEPQSAGRIIWPTCLENIEEDDMPTNSQLDFDEIFSNLLIIVGEGPIRRDAKPYMNEGTDLARTKVLARNVMDQVPASNLRVIPETWGRNDRRLSTNHILLVGSPRSNYVVMEVTPKLPVCMIAVHHDKLAAVRGFSLRTDSAFIGERCGKEFEAKTFVSHGDGVLEIVRNPFNRDKLLIVAMGLYAKGTGTALAALFDDQLRQRTRAILLERDVKFVLVHGEGDIVSIEGEKFEFPRWLFSDIELSSPNTRLEQDAT